MMRSLFYFIVAVTAFSIGAGSVFTYGVVSRYISSSTPASKPRTVTATARIPDSPKSTEPVRYWKPLTWEEKAEVLFGSTIKSWLAGEPVAGYVGPSPEIISRVENDERYRSEVTSLQLTAREGYRPSVIDVDGDKQKELAILPMCTDGGINCALWVLDKTETGFRVILTTIYRPDFFEVVTKRSQNHPEIRTYHDYEEQNDIRGLDIYTFDSGEYSQSNCYEFKYRHRDKNGRWVLIKNPKLVELHCC